MNLQKVFCIYNKNLSFIFDKYLSIYINIKKIKFELR